MDLTLYSTIASASASFVAIIGGLVTSKLISINNERTGIVSSLSDIDEEIELKKKEIEKLQTILDEDNALDFIKEHMDAVISTLPLLEVYETNKQQFIDLETLLPYWKRATELFSCFPENYCELERYQLNDDDIPVDIAEKVKENVFDYDVCSEIASYINGDSYFVGSVSTEGSIRYYQQTQRDLLKCRRELDVLELRKSQYEKQKSTLVRPRNMIAGLWIFGGISLLNILIPLWLIYIIPTYPEWKPVTDICCLASMSIGLLATLIYMIVLLNWNTKE